MITSYLYNILNNNAENFILREKRETIFKIYRKNANGFVKLPFNARHEQLAAT